MTPLLIYFIKANLALALLYISYRLLFQHDTFFKLRRFALLSIYLVAFMYQLPDISTWLSAHGNVSEVVAYYSSVIAPVNSSNQEPVASMTNKTDTILNTLYYIYMVVIILLSFRCLAEFCSVYTIYHKNKKVNINGYQVCLLEDKEDVYSFFRWIFIPDKIINREGYQEVLLHEITHVRQLHSLDVMIGEIITIICWMNPFAWLLKKEIKTNHEYLADQQVIYAGYNKKDYQYHLIGMGRPILAAAKLYNHFSVQPLKKRITMLNKKRTKSVGKAKYLALIPMAAGLLLINNIDAMARILSGSTVAVVSTPTTIAVAGKTIPSTPVTVDKDKVYDLTNNEKVDKEPEFPGGHNAIFQYLSKSIKYPADAQTKGEQGKVLVSFIVEKDGKISNVAIQEKLTDLLDAEALRVVKAMPNWTPAEKNGKKVRTKTNLPITYRLQ